VSRAFTPGDGAAERASGPFTVLFTGRYSPEKSHDVLIDAAARSRTGMSSG
jgi:glycosyltransferase involved in cell wall biosynthesis